jgi:plastocyanin
MTCFRTGTRPLENKKEVQKMKNWYLPLVISVVALLMPVSMANVSAQGELSISKKADKTSAAVGDNITYTYTIVNNGNVTVDNITLEDDKLEPIEPFNKTSLAPGDNVTATATYTVEEDDLPGPLINIATVSGTDPDGNTIADNISFEVKLTYTASIQVTKTANKTTASPGDNITYTYTVTNTGNITADNVTLEDDKLGELMSGVTLSPGKSVTTTTTYEVKTSDFWKLKPITNTATVTATGPDGNSISAKSEQVSVVANKLLMFKALILKLSGVPGKGIENAPGLQKPFNPKSQAAEHAGKKDKPKTPKQLQIREIVENQSTEEQLQIRSEVENQAGSGQATQSDDEARPGKGQLKKNSVTDNQTQGQEATQGNGQNKPDKDKPKNKFKAGNQP